MHPRGPDDPVQDLLSWRRANERRAASAALFLERQLSTEPKPKPKPKVKLDPKLYDCHYCGQPEAATKDHIVPKSRLPHRSGYGGQRNLVPSCNACNYAKGRERSDCGCNKCMYAWENYGPEGWEYLPVLVGLAHPDHAVLPYMGKHRASCRRDAHG